jgi:hypothetical protein
VDTLVGTSSFTADNGFITYDLTGTAAIDASSTVWYLVVCSFTDQALSRSDFSFLVSPGPDVAAEGVTSTDVIQVVGPGTIGGLKTITNSGVGSLKLSSGTEDTSSESITPPCGGVEMLRFILRASSTEGVTVKGIRFLALGTGDESVGVRARLFVDSDGTGSFTGADTQLGGEYIFTVDNGIPGFSGLSLSVPAGETRTLFLVYEFPEGLTEGTFAAVVNPGEAVDAVGTTSNQGVSTTGAPVFGKEKVVVIPEVTEPTGVFGGCGTVAGGGSWLTWLLGLALLAAAAGLVRMRRRQTA